MFAPPWQECQKNVKSERFLGGQGFLLVVLYKIPFISQKAFSIPKLNLNVIRLCGVKLLNVILCMMVSCENLRDGVKKCNLYSPFWRQFMRKNHFK